MISENLIKLQQRIDIACQRCGRKKEEIQIVAVSKAFSVEKIKEAIDSGLLDFGENYVQELQIKRKELINYPIKWHFVGHLQTNKVKYIADYIHLIHSVDNMNVAEEINKRAKQHNRMQKILIEVRTTDEDTKFGIRPNKVVDLVKMISKLSNVEIYGLMTMGPFAEDPELSRPSFRQLSEIKKKVESEGIENVKMTHLSMGMSNDLEIAIEEGATILRIGTAIFGERN